MYIIQLQFTLNPDKSPAYVKNLDHTASDCYTKNLRKAMIFSDELEAHKIVTDLEERWGDSSASLRQLKPVVLRHPDFDQLRELKEL